MTWLEEVDLAAARQFARALGEARTAHELRRMVLAGLSDLVPADILSWNRISLHGAIEHEVSPVDAEPAGAFSTFAHTAAQHPLLRPHAVRPRPAIRLSEAIEPRRLHRSELYAELLRRSGSEYGVSIRIQSTSAELDVVALGRHERQFSERDLDVLDLVAQAVGRHLGFAQARERLVRALADEASSESAILLLDRYGEIEQSSTAAERWLSEHFGPGEHPAWLPEPVAVWLALPPRPPLVSARHGRRLTVTLLPGDPHALLLEERVESFRAGTLDRLGLSHREGEVLEAAHAIGEQPRLADELFLSVRAVREQLEHLNEKLGVDTVAEAIAAALRESA